MKKRHSPEHIVRKLRQVDEKLASVASVPEVARELGVSEATCHSWRNRCGGMNPSETKRLKELEKDGRPALTWPKNRSHLSKWVRRRLIPTHTFRY